MEASGGTTATTDTGTGGDAAPDTGEDTTQQAPDFEAFADKMERQMDERLSGLEQSWAERNQEPDNKEGEDPYADLYEGLEPGEPVDVKALTESIETRALEKARSEMQEMVGPILDRLRDQDLSKLEETYPELQSAETAEPVVAAARQLAESLGDPELIENPAFVETVYLAQKGRSRAEQETPAGAQQDGTSLEPGGAAPQEPAMSQLERIAAQSQDPGQRTWNW